MSRRTKLGPEWGITCLMRTMRRTQAAWVSQGVLGWCQKMQRCLDPAQLSRDCARLAKVRSRKKTTQGASGGRTEKMGVQGAVKIWGTSQA